MHNMTIDAKMTRVTFPIDQAPQATVASIELEGRKHWPAANKISFETTEFNLRIWRRCFEGSIQEVDNRPAAFEFEKDAIRNAKVELLPDDPVPNFVHKPFDFQLGVFNRFKNQRLMALFAEAGTGKTKMFIDILCHKFLKGEVTGCIVLASPRGVHHQWVNEQIPEHIWKNVNYQAAAWDGKKFPEWIKDQPTSKILNIITANIDVVKSIRGYEYLEEFIELHKDKLMFAIDESQSIMTPGFASINRKTGKLSISGSKRTYIICELAHRNSIKMQRDVGHRAIMTGTPIAKNLIDVWSQFRFLSPDIIGHKYLASFKTQYCVMGGYEGRQVIAHRNHQQFNKLIAPYSFNATKQDELDLPPKVYDKIIFDLSDEQRRYMKQLKENFLVVLEDGSHIAVKNAISVLVKMQQIASGFLVMEDGSIKRLKGNPRMDAFKTLRATRRGKMIIWARFTEDIEALKRELGDKAVTYYGKNSQKERDNAKLAFMDESSGVDNMIAHAGAAGAGLNLQGAERTAAYYSNSFNSIERWQSEDRIHRIGMIGTATYFDLIARCSPDRGILQNLKRKADFANMALSDLRRMVDEIV